MNINDIKYTVGTTDILKGISLNIDKGEKIALIGSSGAGKTTFLKLLSQSIQVSSGAITIDEGSIIGLLPQSFDLIESSTVQTNILLGKLREWTFFKSIYHILIKKMAVKTILKQVNLVGFEKKRIFNLSGGEKQRVALGRLLAQNPNIFLADEPVASLDPFLSKQILSLLIKASRNNTLIVSLHQKELATQYFDRIIAFKDGRVFFDKATSDISFEEMEAVYE
jgi:phosphonate transport system ATP-binding protein